MATAIADGITKATQWHLERSKVEWCDGAKAAKKKLESDPHNAEIWLELGLALGEQSLFREAIQAYSMGLGYDPFNVALYRHRGHRYLSIGEVENFIADLCMCLRLDPNNWWAAYYLQEGFLVKGEYELAEKVCRQCLEISGPGDLVEAVVDWYWMALMRQGKKEEAKEILKVVEDKLNAPGPKQGYLARLAMYAGLTPVEDMEKVVANMENNGGFCTLGYGLANYYYVTGEEEKANKLILEIIKRDEGCWNLSGYFCAVEEAKMRNLL